MKSNTQKLLIREKVGCNLDNLSDTVNFKILALFLLMWISVFNSRAQEVRPKYNILFLSCEDIDPTIACYGAKGINTPNIDRLAKEGIRYTNAYSTVGVCAPSRSSIITGVYPVRLGTHNMRTGDHYRYRGIDGETYASYRKLTGKRGRNIPFYSAVPDIGIKCFTEFLRIAGYYCTNNLKCDYQFYPPFTAWDENNETADYKHIPENMPFFSVFNHEVTHESRIWRKANDPLLTDPDEVRVPDYYPDISVVRNDIARKYSNIEELDAQIGQRLKRLEEENLLDKTIIFFWSDHGGPLLRQKRAVGNSGLHVPLIIRFPDTKLAGTVDTNLVSLMDLAPTVLSLTGIKPPSYMDGKAFLGDYKEERREAVFGSADRFDETYDYARSVIDGEYVYIRNFNTSIPYIYRLEYRVQIKMTQKLIEMDRKGELSGGAAYIFRDSRDVEELYNIKEDPDEVHNLAADPNNHAQLIKMRKQLADWQLEVGDKGLIDEYDLVQMFWPGFIQPETEDVKIVQTSNEIRFFTPTEGASIGYQTDELIGSERWLLYSKPIKLNTGQKIVVRAKRIGYTTSKPVEYDVN